MTKHQLKTRRVHTSVNLAWLVFLLLLFLVARDTWDRWGEWTKDRRHPIAEGRYDSFEVLNSPIHAGDVLWTRTYRTKVRSDCQDVTPFRVATDTNGVNYPLPSHSWPGGDPTAEYVDIGYPTRDDLPPGVLILSGRVKYTCDDGGIFWVDIPPTPFRVED